MHRYVLAFVALVIGVIAISTVSAGSLTSAQRSAVISILQSFGVSESVLSNVRLALDGHSITPAPASVPTTSTTLARPGITSTSATGANTMEFLPGKDLTITGTGFAKYGSPKVYLAGERLAVISYTDTSVTVRTPSTVPTGKSYGLVITSGEATSQTASVFATGPGVTPPAPFVATTPQTATQTTTQTTQTQTNTQTTTTQTTQQQTQGPSAVTAPGQLSMRDLTYLGAFRGPDITAGMGQLGDSSSVSFRADGDPSGGSDGYPGSLYITNRGSVAEISIPAPSKSTSVGSLPSARQIQSTTNLMAGVSLGSNDRLGAVAWVSPRGTQATPKLYWTSYIYYNVSGDDYPSMGWADPSLSAPNATGLWHVGLKAPNWDSAFHGQKYGDYIIPIDQAWADQNTSGRSVLVGRLRGAGAFGGSMGPVLTAIAPWQDGNPPSAGANLGATPLMFFNNQQGHVGTDKTWMDWRWTGDPDYEYFSAGDSWRGGAWVVRNGKKALIMVARHGTFDNDPPVPYNGRDGGGGAVGSNTPPFCYGTGGVECPYGVAVTNYKGYHNGPYRPRIVFFDIDDLAKSAKGQLAPNKVLPYQVYDPGRNEWIWKDAGNSNDVAGIAYDSANGLLYIVQSGAYNPGGPGMPAYPVFHVYRVQ